MRGQTVWIVADELLFPLYPFDLSPSGDVKDLPSKVAERILKGSQASAQFILAISYLEKTAQGSPIDSNRKADLDNHAHPDIQPDAPRR
jgi:hypothetical protein